MPRTPPADTDKPWTLLQHEGFRIRFNALTTDVEALRGTDPDGYRTHPKAKLLKRISDVVFTEVPRDPASDVYLLGNTLGGSHRRWRRAKFLQRFRLFFRFDTATRVIIYAWVNDETSLRKEGGKTDPYTVFKGRLAKGDPPTDWTELLRTARPLPIPAPEAE